MKCSSLFRFHTVAVQLLFTGIFLCGLNAAVAVEVNGQSTSGGSTSVANPFAAFSQRPLTDACEIATATWTDAKGALSCDSRDLKACKEKIAKCQAISITAGEKVLEDGEDATADNICPEIEKENKECAYKAITPPNQVRDEIRDEKRHMDDTRKECNSLTKEASKERSENAKSANQTNDNALKSSKDYNKEKLEISKQMRDALTGMNDATAKAAAEGLKQADALRQAGIKLQEELSRKVDLKNTTYVKWQTACLGAAEDARQKVEDDFDKYIEESSKIKKNYALNSAAGLRLRLLKQKMKKERQAYNNMKAKCMTGTKGPGGEMKVAYDSASRDVNTSTVNFKNQTAEIARQDQVNQMQLEQAKQQNFQKYQQAVGDLQQRSAQLDSDRMQDQMNEMRKQASDSGVLAQNTKETSENLAKCRKDLDDSKNKIAGLDIQLNQCGPRAGVRSNKDIEEKDKANQEDGKAIALYKKACAAGQLCAASPKDCTVYTTMQLLRKDCLALNNGTVDAGAASASDPSKFKFEVGPPVVSGNCYQTPNPTVTDPPVAATVSSSTTAPTAPPQPTGIDYGAIVESLGSSTIDGATTVGPTGVFNSHVR